MTDNAKPKPIDEATIERLKAENPKFKLATLTAPTGEQILVRRPNREIWKRFVGETMRASSDSIPGANMLTTCLVYPDAAGFEAMLDDAPALEQVFAIALQQLAGYSSPDKIEKKAT